MKRSLITLLRDKRSGMSTFRRAAHRLAHLLAQEALHYVKEKKITVETPFEKTAGHQLEQPVVLVPILRSGIALLPTFLYYFENAPVGFMGLKRDEKTAIAHEYYRNLPKIDKKSQVIVLDPMLATGGSAVSTLEALVQGGISEKQILFVCLIAAPEGIRTLKRNFPKIKMVIGVKDRELNAKKFILPGIGDFGDRYFGTL